VPGFLPLSLLFSGLAEAGSPTSSSGTAPPGATSAAAYRAPVALPAPTALPSQTLAKRSDSGISLDLETAGHCARSSALMGEACSFLTGMTARRVIEEGMPWAWAGALTPRGSEGDLAAPYFADESTRVLATELLERLSSTPWLMGTNLFIGRTLEIDGVTYVVLTAFAPVDT
jgi:hypothetical protein